jgi:hypothetical protein
VNLDKMPGKDLQDFGVNVIRSYADRDASLADTKRIEDQDWTVTVPDAWKITAKTQHSSLPKDIIHGTIGNLIQREPVCTRTSPDEDEKATERATNVKRYLQARFQYDRKHAIPGKDAWEFVVGQIIRTGAACVGNLYAPHNWANYPDFFEDATSKTPKQDYWRDSSGSATDDAKKEDRDATSRYYKKIVDNYCRRAMPPTVHRFVPTVQCYPAFAGNELVAMVIQRYASPFEIADSGFVWKGTKTKDDASIVTRDIQLTEVWTKNKYHYFVGDEELRHKQFGKGVDTGYGFVPYHYQVGLEGGDLEWGSYGLPLLSLVKHNLVMIDTLLTFRYNALHIAGFTSFQMAYDKDSESAYTIGAGDEQRTYKITTGAVNDFGPGRKIEPLLHPGLSMDFRQALADERGEIRRIIPDVLTGMAESSGYNTAQATTRALAKFTPMVNGGEHLLEGNSVMELRHIADRVPAAVYLNYAWPQNALSSKPRNVTRISLEGKDVDNYFDVTWNVDREIDRITLGNWAAQMHAAGHFDREWVFDISGGVDFQQSEARRLRDEFKQDPSVRAVLMQRALKRFNLTEEKAQAEAAAQIQMMPDGTPAVNGIVPPGGGGLPSMQGPAGAMLGGQNMASAGPNMGSVGNPNIGMPPKNGAATITRRGGNPGAPQLQGMTKPNLGVP